MKSSFANESSGKGLTATDCAPAVSPEIAGTFFVRGLVLAEATERNITLVLNPDGTAILMTEFVGRGTLVERGCWSEDDAKANVLWTELDGEAIHLRMTFELRGNDLVCIGPDPNAFGAKGIRLQRAVETAQQQVARPTF